MKLLPRLFAWFRRTPPPVFAEQDAYSRLHGNRSGEVHVRPVPPRAPRMLPRLPGDYLRRCFEERLEGRHTARH